LKTTIEKYNQDESKLEKITSFFCKPLFERKNFDFFIKKSKKLKKMKEHIKKHKKACNTNKNYNFKIFTKTSNLLYRKETYYQRILQIICIKKNILNLIIADSSDTNSRKKKICVAENLGVEMFSQNNFSGEKYTIKETLDRKNFPKKFSGKKKKKRKFLLKSEKKLFFFDLKKKKIKLNPFKALFLQKCERKIFKNYGLISWENFLLNNSFYTKKNSREIAEHRKGLINFSEPKNYLKDFQSKKNQKDWELSFTTEAYTFENFQEANILKHREKPNFFPLKIQDIIVGIDTAKITLSKKSIKKINLCNVFGDKIWCIYNVFYPYKLFENISLLSAQKKKKEKFFYYFICFLHSAFQKKDILVGEIRLNIFYLLTHVN